MRAYRWLFGGLAAALLVIGPGCGGSGKVQVQGTVTLDGQPVGGATVEFLPLGGGGQPARGFTGADGTFRLGTLDAADGARPGEYRVLVTKVELDPTLLERVDPSDAEGAARQQKAGAEFLRKPKKWLVPRVYADASTTPLRWRVPEDNHKTLELSSTGAPGSARE